MCLSSLVIQVLGAHVLGTVLGTGNAITNMAGKIGFPPGVYSPAGKADSKQGYSQIADTFQVVMGVRKKPK